MGMLSRRSALWGLCEAVTMAAGELREDDLVHGHHEKWSLEAVVEAAGMNSDDRVEPNDSMNELNVHCVSACSVLSDRVIEHNRRSR